MSPGGARLAGVGRRRRGCRAPLEQGAGREHRGTSDHRLPPSAPRGQEAPCRHFLGDVFTSGTLRAGAPMDDSFARYLAKVLAAKHGFSPGTVPEAGRLASAADFVLTRSNGLTLSVVCIVDAERDPSRRFGIGRDELIEIGKACRAKYSGTVSGAKMPSVIEIVEVRSSVTDEDRERLKPLRSRTGAVCPIAARAEARRGCETRGPARLSRRTRRFRPGGAPASPGLSLIAADPRHLVRCAQGELRHLRHVQRHPSHGLLPDTSG